MAVTHRNRKGETYHLLVGKTKTGKPKYYASKKAGENAVEAIPDGYEIYENPVDAVVHVRKIRPTNVTEAERAQVVAGVRQATGRQHFFAEIDGDAIVVYWPNRDPIAVESLFGRLTGMPGSEAASISNWTVRHTRYEAQLRFSLSDADKRQFCVERMCYRGGEDRWIYVSGQGPLMDLVAKFARHLGQESFFELM